MRIAVAVMMSEMERADRRQLRQRLGIDESSFMFTHETVGRVPSRYHTRRLGETRAVFSLDRRLSGGVGWLGAFALRCANASSFDTGGEVHGDGRVPGRVAWGKGALEVMVGGCCERRTGGPVYLEVSRDDPQSGGGVTSAPLCAKWRLVVAGLRELF